MADKVVKEYIVTDGNVVTGEDEKKVFGGEKVKLTEDVAAKLKKLRILE